MKPTKQHIQVHITVHAPMRLQRRMGRQFFLEVLEALALGNDIPGITLTAVIWEKDEKVYEYEGEVAIDALRKAVSVFGLGAIADVMARRRPAGPR